MNAKVERKSVDLHVCLRNLEESLVSEFCVEEFDHLNSTWNGTMQQVSGALSLFYPAAESRTWHSDRHAWIGEWKWKHEARSETMVARTGGHRVPASASLGDNLDVTG